VRVSVGSLCRHGLVEEEELDVFLRSGLGGSALLYRPGGRCHLSVEVWVAKVLSG
jgi:hypothetical protein